MENTYLTAINGMPMLLLGVNNPMEYFKKNLYSAAFRKYYESNLTTYQAVEEGYARAIDKDQYILNMASALCDAAVEKMEGCSKKRDREALTMDFNLCMVVYVFPGILKYAGDSAKPLTDQILKLWKMRFPQSNISAAPLEDIEAGFHKKFCYITTAVCEMFQKPDDCYELNLLREYRDNYLLAQPDGEEIIREYYDVAPTIVKRINHMPEKKKIYQDVWDSYLSPCISMIEHQKMAECRELYIKMVRDLQEEYFYQN